MSGAGGPRGLGYQKDDDDRRGDPEGWFLAVSGSGRCPARAGFGRRHAWGAGRDSPRRLEAQRRDLGYRALREGEARTDPCTRSSRALRQCNAPRRRSPERSRRRSPLSASIASRPSRSSSRRGASWKGSVGRAPSARQAFVERSQAHPPRQERRGGSPRGAVGLAQGSSRGWERRLDGAQVLANGGQGAASPRGPGAASRAEGCCRGLGIGRGRSRGRCGSGQGERGGSDDARAGC